MPFDSNAVVPFNPKATLVNALVWSLPSLSLKVIMSIGHRYGAFTAAAMNGLYVNPFKAALIAGSMVTTCAPINRFPTMSTV